MPFCSAHHLCGVGGLEPRQIRFAEIAHKNHGSSASWKDLSSKQQAELIREALKPDQLLLDPQSPYLRYWDLLILCALAFTALVTPYEVAFLNTKLDFLFGCNCCVDIIFFKDLIMQFFLKVQVFRPEGTVWVRDRASLAKRYIKGWFVIDVVSILPFNIVGLALQNEQIQKLKIVKVVRLLRLLKLVRILRASRIIKRYQNRTSLSFASQGLIKFTTLLLVCSHLMACLWGMVGILLCEDLMCDSNDLKKYEFVETETNAGYSWVSAKSWGHHSPCESVDVYLASLHFSVMTITSIGYGDITPTRNEEYVVGILCQLGGGLTWAFVIGSICGIIAHSNPTKVQYENSMDALNLMLREQGISFETCLELRDFIREKQYHDHLCRSRAINDTFSPQMQTKLIPQTVIGKAIMNIWYFHDADINFVVEVAAKMVPKQYANQDRIGERGVLSIVQRGSVAISGRILCPGCFWGEDMILSDPDLTDPTQGIALNYVEVLALSKENLEKIVVNYPQMASQIRKAAALITFRMAVKSVARERMHGKQDKSAFQALKVDAKSGTPNSQMQMRRSQTLAQLGSAVTALKEVELDVPDDNGRTLGGNTASLKPIEECRLPIEVPALSLPAPDDGLSKQVTSGFQMVMAEIHILTQDLSNMKEGLDDVKAELRNIREVQSGSQQITVDSQPVLGCVRLKSKQTCKIMQ